ncbi:ATP-binding protein [Frankia nepalensis]|uniref:ATP-binding protein n=1 Tax=Frankia nepalensis TaxID=1836974 RepID=UPI0027DBE5CB|nr:ATP-binding protein [Frankia nepalensis]
MATLPFVATLLWINGPNAVGKTQVAFSLARRLPGSFVSDPEHLGFAMRRMLPKARRVDFREIPLWRHGAGAMLARALAGDEDPVIVPMTVVDVGQLAELTAPARDAGHRVQHVTLLASPATMRRRIQRRGETSRGFSARQVDHSLAVLRGEGFARHLDTDDLTIAQVADDIAHGAGFTPRPETDGLLARRARQLTVQLRHIRVNP